MQDSQLNPDSALHDFVIVGAGMAGLSAAWARRTRHLLGLDAAEHAGGRLHGVEAAGLPLGLGAHMVAGEGSRIGALVGAMGLDAAPLPPRLFALAEGGRHYRHTPQTLPPLAMRLSMGGRLAFVRFGLALRWGRRAAFRSRAPGRASPPWPRGTGR